MNRKHNPLLSLVVLLLLAAILALTCIGCGEARAETPTTAATEKPESAEPTAEPTAATEPQAGEHFTITMKHWSMYGDLYIITDEVTGVRYLVITHDRGVGLTKLEEAPKE